MRILYFNNFRGFQQTLIPIHKVNFFVGENSTGKTSVLKLLKILSDPTFKYTYDFSSAIVDLGRFDDIVNKTNSSGDYFEIAMMAKFEEVDANIYGPIDNKPCFLKFQFREIDEKVRLSDLSIYTSQYEALINYNRGEYRYDYKRHEFISKAFNEDLSGQFADWCIKPSYFVNSPNFQNMETDSFFKSNPRWVFIDIFEKITKQIAFDDNNKQISNFTRHYMTLIESFVPNIRWIAPIRAEPRRIYEHMETKDSVDGSHAPQVLRDILGGAKSKSLEKFTKFLNNFGKKSRMFDEIKVKKFGSEKFAPFEIQIILEGKPYSISNVGYGVSQVLPLLLEVFDEKNSWLAIQQPEVHLHPRAQAEFGELIFNAAKQTSKVFFIETHSDFTIDRFRYCFSKDNSLKDNIDSQVLFFTRNKKRNSVEIIPITFDGNYYCAEKSDFRKFFINESIKLLGI